MISEIKEQGFVIDDISVRGFKNLFEVVYKSTRSTGRL